MLKPVVFHVFFSIFAFRIPPATLDMREHAKTKALPGISCYVSKMLTKPVVFHAILGFLLILTPFAFWKLQCGGILDW